MNDKLEPDSKLETSPNTMLQKKLENEVETLREKIKHQLGELERLRNEFIKKNRIKEPAYLNLERQINILKETESSLEKRYLSLIKKFFDNLKNDVENLPNSLVIIQSAIAEFDKELRNSYSILMNELPLLSAEEKYQESVSKIVEFKESFTYPEDYLTDQTLVEHLNALENLKKNLINPSSTALSHKEIQQKIEAFEQADKKNIDYLMKIEEIKGRIKLLNEQPKLIKSNKAKAAIFSLKIASPFQNKNKSASNLTIIQESIRLNKIKLVNQMKDLNFLYTQMKKAFVGQGIDSKELEKIKTKSNQYLVIHALEDKSKELEEVKKCIKGMESLRKDLDKMTQANVWIFSKIDHNVGVASGETVNKKEMREIHKKEGVSEREEKENTSEAQDKKAINEVKKKDIFDGILNQQNIFKNLYTDLRKEMELNKRDMKVIETIKDKFDANFVRSDLSPTAKLNALIKDTEKLKTTIKTEKDRIREYKEEEVKQVMARLKSDIDFLKAEHIDIEEADKQAVKEIEQFSVDDLKKIIGDSLDSKLTAFIQLEHRIMDLVEATYKKKIQIEKDKFIVLYDGIKTNLEQHKLIREISQINGLYQSFLDKISTSDPKNSFKEIQALNLKLDKVTKRLTTKITVLKFNEKQVEKIRVKEEVFNKLYSDVENKLVEYNLSTRALTQQKINFNKILLNPSLPPHIKVRSLTKIIEEFKSLILKEKENINTSISTQKKNLEAIASELIIIELEPFYVRLNFPKMPDVQLRRKENDAIKQLAKAITEINLNLTSDVFLKKRADIERYISEVKHIKTLYEKASNISTQDFKSVLDMESPEGQQILSTYFHIHLYSDTQFNALENYMLTANTKQSDITISEFCGELLSDTNNRDLSVRLQDKVKDKGRELKNLFDAKNLLKNLLDQKAKYFHEKPKDYMDYFNDPMKKEAIRKLMSSHLFLEMTLEVLDNTMLCKVISQLKERPLTPEILVLLKDSATRCKLFLDINDVELSNDFNSSKFSAEHAEELLNLVLKCDQNIIEAFNKIKTAVPEQITFSHLVLIQEIPALQTLINDSTDLKATALLLKNLLLGTKDLTPERIIDFSKNNHTIISLVSQINKNDKSDLENICNFIEKIDYLAGDYVQKGEKDKVKSINQFREESLSILLDKQATLENKHNRIKELANDKFNHKHKWPRIFADVMMFLTVSFIVIIPLRMLLNKSALISTGNTSRKDKILSGFQEIFGDPGITAFKSRKSRFEEIKNPEKQPLTDSLLRNDEIHSPELEHGQDRFSTGPSTPSTNK